MTTSIQNEIAWLTKIGEYRSQHPKGDFREQPAVAPPVLKPAKEAYAAFIQKNKLQADERLLLLLSLIPHIQPDYLELQIASLSSKTPRFSTDDRADCILGKIKGTSFTGLLPSGLFFLYLMAGFNLELRLEIMRKMILADYFLVKENIITITQTPPFEPLFSGCLCLQQNYLYHFLTGEKKYIKDHGNT